MGERAMLRRKRTMMSIECSCGLICPNVRGKLEVTKDNRIVRERYRGSRVEDRIVHHPRGALQIAQSPEHSEATYVCAFGLKTSRPVTDHNVVEGVHTSTQASIDALFPVPRKRKRKLCSFVFTIGPHLGLYRLLNLALPCAAPQIQREDLMQKSDPRRGFEILAFKTLLDRCLKSLERAFRLSQLTSPPHRTIHPPSLLLLLPHPQIRKLRRHDPSWSLPGHERIPAKIRDTLVLPQEILIHETPAVDGFDRCVEDGEDGVGEDGWLAESGFVGFGGLGGGGVDGLCRLGLRFSGLLGEIRVKVLSAEKGKGYALLRARDW